MARELLKGNQAFAEAAVRAGLQAYFGYPITPQTEALEWMAARMVELGRAFVQAESEVAAINMVYGAACTGARVMSSSSSPGMSLMMEGLSYIAGTEVRIVLVDVMRGGPGLGNIAPSQGDYNQIVHGRARRLPPDRPGPRHKSRRRSTCSSAATASPATSPSSSMSMAAPARRVRYAAAR